MPQVSHAQVGAAPKTDEVTFRLVVPEQATFVETRTFEKLISYGDKEPTEVETLSQTSDVVIRRRGTGFLVSVKPRPAKEREEPGSAAQGVMEALRALRLQYEFDGQGNLVALRGTEKFREELASIAPPEMKAMLDALMVRVVEDLKDEWGSRYQGLVGQTFRIGYRQTSEVPMTLAPKIPPLTAKMGRGVSGRQPCDGRECVAFFMGYVVENTDGYGEAITGMLREWSRQMLKGWGSADAPAAIRQLEAAMPKLKVTEIVCLTQRLVDPLTMTVHSERRTKGFTGVIDGRNAMHWLEVTTLEYKRVS